MDTFLPLTASPTSASPRPGRMAGRGPDPGSADAPGDIGGFARALNTAVTRGTGAEVATGSVAGAGAGASAGPLASRSAGVGVPMAGSDANAQGPSPGLRRPLTDLRDARAVSGPSVDAAVSAAAALSDAVVQDGAEPGDTLARASGQEDGEEADAIASAGPNTALMQWMLQLAPPPPAPVLAPTPPPGAFALGLPGRQDGTAMLPIEPSAFPSVRPETKGRDDATHAAATDAPDGRDSGAGAAAVTFPVLQTPTQPDAGALRGEFPTRSAAATALPSTVTVAAEPRTLASATASTATSPSATELQALWPAAAQAAAATALATPAGSPVPAPAQTWIQTPVTQPGFSDDVVVELVRHVGQAEQGTHALTLHLNPQELGPVSVSIELNGRTARIEFTASEALTRHHLEATLPGLTEALQDQGVSLTQGGVHEASKESLAASAAGGQASGGAGSDARQRGDALFDGRSGHGERAPRRESEVFTVDGRAVSEGRLPVSNGLAPGRAGRLDLFA